MAGQFVCAEEDSDEYEDFTLYGIQPEGTGEFRLTEDENDEYELFVLFGVEEEEPEPEPEVRPRWTRRREYIERVTSMKMSGLGFIEYSSTEKKLAYLSLVKSYYGECAVNIGIALQRERECPMQPLELIKFFSYSITMEDLRSVVEHINELPFEGLNYILITLSSELNVNTPDVIKNQLGRFMKYMEYLEYADESSE